MDLVTGLNLPYEHTGMAPNVVSNLANCNGLLFFFPK